MSRKENQGCGIVTYVSKMYHTLRDNACVSESGNEVPASGSLQKGIATSKLWGSGPESVSDKD